MNKQEIMKMYAKEEDKLLVAKILDKVQFTREKNYIQITEFLDGYQQKIAKNVVKHLKCKECVFFGGYEEAERKMLFLFPEKLIDLVQLPLQESKIIQDKIKVITINLPKDLKEKYHHRDYLGGLMKLGIKREKIGDILVRDDGADVIVQDDMTNYLLSNLKELTRFQKTETICKSISDLKSVSIKMEASTIIVTQLRLDTIISAILHISRTKTNEIIEQERVLVNYETRTKSAVILKEGDLLTIRGKGKFKIGEIISQTSKGKIRVEVWRYTS